MDQLASILHMGLATFIIAVHNIERIGSGPTLTPIGSHLLERISIGKLPLNHTQRDVKPINIAKLMEFLIVNKKEEDDCINSKYSKFYIKSVVNQSYTHVNPMLVCLSQPIQFYFQIFNRLH
jgi:hypothetical protein